MSTLDIEKVRCPKCGHLAIIRFDGLLAPHNVGWLPPVNGVSYPIRCPGSLLPAPKASA